MHYTKCRYILYVSFDFSFLQFNALPRAAARAVSYAEKSSDEDEGSRRGKRSTSITKSEEFDDDASDYGDGDEEENNSDEDDDASVALSSNDEVESHVGLSSTKSARKSRSREARTFSQWMGPAGTVH